MSVGTVESLSEWDREQLRHRMESHVQFYMPFRPSLGSELFEPLRYLRKEVSENYTSEELEMSEAVLRFSRGKDSPKEIAEKIMRQTSKKGSILVVGDAGSGKTIYSGMLFSHLCEMVGGTSRRDGDLLIYSQLKDVSSPGSGLWEQIVEGLRIEGVPQGITIPSFSKLLASVTQSEKGAILVIDSLDEIRYSAKQFSKVVDDLNSEKIYPVWFCRTHYYESMGMREIIEGRGWKLAQVPTLERKEVRAGDQKNKWIEHAYSTLPLLYSLKTNFNFNKGMREELHGGLKGSLEKLWDDLSVIMRKGGFNVDQEMSVSDWADIAGKQSNAVPIITDVIAEYMIDRAKKAEDKMIESPKESKMNAFLEKIARLLKQGFMERGFLDEKAPAKVIDKDDGHEFVFQDVEKLLTNVGLLSKKRDGVLRFSHRAFTEHLLWKSLDMKERSELVAKDDPLFSWRRFLLSPKHAVAIAKERWPRDQVGFWAVRSTEGGDSKNVIAGDLKTLLSKTGCVLATMPPVEEFYGEEAIRYEEPWATSLDIWEIFGDVLSKKGLRDLDSSRDDPSRSLGLRERERQISKKQYEALADQVHDLRPIQLRGHPGTGKTFTGVEVIIQKIGNSLLDRRDGKEALILTLNEALSRDIQADIVSKHSESRGIPRELDIEYLAERIHAMSLSEIFHYWLGDDVASKLVRPEDLQNWFEDISKNINKKLFGGRIDGLFIHANSDYHKSMFGFDGRILEEQEYLKVSELLKEAGKLTGANDEIAKETATEWYRKINQKIKTGMLPLPTATICLIEILRWLEDTHPPSWELDEALDKLNYNQYFHKKTGRVLRRTEWLLLPKEERGNYEKRTSRPADDFGEELFRKANLDTGGGVPPYFDFALVDEIQDMPPQSIVLVSYLTKNRAHPHDLIFAGDHAQALQFSGFNWSQFFGYGTRLAEDLLNKIDEKDRQVHHLVELLKLEREADEIPNLSENHRNPGNVFSSMIDAVHWNPLNVSGWKPTDSVKDIPRMKSMKPEEGKVTVKLCSSSEEYEQELRGIFNLASNDPFVALVICDTGLERVFTEAMKEGVEEAKGVFKDYGTEVFTPFTIKGLERPRVIVIGGWMVSESGVNLDIFRKNVKFHKGKPDIDNNDIDRINRLMLVALSRAEETTQVIIPPNGVFGGSGEVIPKKAKNRFVQLPPPERLIRKYKGDLDLTPVSRAQSGVSAFVGLASGIKYNRKAKYNLNLKKQLTANRWKTLNFINLELSAQEKLERDVTIRENDVTIRENLIAELDDLIDVIDDDEHSSELKEKISELKEEISELDARIGVRGGYYLTEYFAHHDGTNKLENPLRSSTLFEILIHYLYGEAAVKELGLEPDQSSKFHDSIGRSGGVIDWVREGRNMGFDDLLEFAEGMKKLYQLVRGLKSEYFTDDRAGGEGLIRREIVDAINDRLGEGRTIEHYGEASAGLVMEFGKLDVIDMATEGGQIQQFIDQYITFASNNNAPAISSMGMDEEKLHHNLMSVLLGIINLRPPIGLSEGDPRWMKVAGKTAEDQRRLNSIWEGIDDDSFKKFIERVIESISDSDWIQDDRNREASEIRNYWKSIEFELEFMIYLPQLGAKPIRAVHRDTVDRLLGELFRRWLSECGDKKGQKQNLLPYLSSEHKHGFDLTTGAARDIGLVPRRLNNVFDDRGSSFWSEVTKENGHHNFNMLSREFRIGFLRSMMRDYFGKEQDENEKILLSVTNLLEDAERSILNKMTPKNTGYMGQELENHKLLDDIPRMASLVAEDHDQKRELILFGKEEGTTPLGVDSRRIDLLAQLWILMSISPSLPYLGYRKPKIPVKYKILSPAGRPGKSSMRPADFRKRLLGLAGANKEVRELIDNKCQSLLEERLKGEFLKAEGYVNLKFENLRPMFHYWALQLFETERVSKAHGSVVVQQLSTEMTLIYPSLPLHITRSKKHGSPTPSFNKDYQGIWGHLVLNQVQDLLMDGGGQERSGPEFLRVSGNMETFWDMDNPDFKPLKWTNREVYKLLRTFMGPDWREMDEGKASADHTTARSRPFQTEITISSNENEFFLNYYEICVTIHDILIASFEEGKKAAEGGKSKSINMDRIWKGLISSVSSIRESGIREAEWRDVSGATIALWPAPREILKLDDSKKFRTQRLYDNTGGFIIQIMREEMGMKMKGGPAWKMLKLIDADGVTEHDFHRLKTFKKKLDYEFGYTIQTGRARYKGQKKRTNSSVLYRGTRRGASDWIDATADGLGDASDLRY